MKTRSLKVALAHIFLTSSMAVGVLTTACCAQMFVPIRTVIADVPFSFVSGSDLMPAGRYRIEELSNHLVVLQSEDRKQIHHVFGLRVQTLGTAANSKLVFHRYGDQCFLYQVWSAGRADAIEIPKEHAEVEMLRAQNHPRPTTTEVASSDTSKH